MRKQNKWVVLLALGLCVNTYGVSTETRLEVEHYAKVADMSPVLSTAVLLDSSNPNALNNNVTSSIFNLATSKMIINHNDELTYLSGNNDFYLAGLKSFMSDDLAEQELNPFIQECVNKYHTAQIEYYGNTPTATNTQKDWFVDRSIHKQLRITSQFEYRDDGMHRALDIGTMQEVGENGNQGEWNVYPVGQAKIIKIQTNPNTDTIRYILKPSKEV